MTLRLANSPYRFSLLCSALALAVAAVLPIWEICVWRPEWPFAITDHGYQLWDAVGSAAELLEVGGIHPVLVHHKGNLLKLVSVALLGAASGFVWCRVRRKAPAIQEAAKG